MINIAELLKDTPRGTKLYSPLFGEVEFSHVTNSRNMVIYVLTPRGFKHFTSDGNAIVEYINGVMMASQECLLFPSKECRTWENFKLPTKPNFKVGDWVVDQTFAGPEGYIGEVGIVEGVTMLGDVKKENYYAIRGTDGKLLGGTDRLVREYYLRPWAITDAKDGDVLVSGIDNPFIYNGNNDFSFVGAYVGISRNGEIMLDMFPSKAWTSIKGVKPAAKEQRDLLFQKMKEAGYQWDDDKKELRKIQPHYDISNFYAGMPVLVRDYDNSRWSYVQFSHYVGECGMKFNACGIPYIQCIPFNDDTKHLLGTNDMPDEKYVNW